MRLTFFFILALTVRSFLTAGTLLQFSPDGSTPNLTPTNGVYEVSIYLNQHSVGATDLSIDGLSSFGFTASVNPAEAQVVGIQIADPFLEFGRPQIFPSAVVDFVGVELGTGVRGTSILLGSLSIRPLTSNAFSLELFDTMLTGDDFVTTSGVSLDADFFSTPSSSPSLQFKPLNVIPEPSTFALSSLVGLICLVRRSRSMRQDAEES